MAETSTGPPRARLALVLVAVFALLPYLSGLRTDFAFDDFDDEGAARAPLALTAAAAGPDPALGEQLVGAQRRLAEKAGGR